jgi:transposase
MTISLELRAQILRLHQVERWPAGTIARQLRLHRDTVKRVLRASSLMVPTLSPRARQIDAYLPLITATLTKFPRLTASRLHVMVQERGYRGASSHFRHQVAKLRPRRNPEAFLRLRTLPGEQSQIDWAHFDHIVVGKARRPLMAFVMTLSYSRRIFLHFSLNARMDSFLTGHVLAFEAFGGVPHVILSDNLKSAVLERIGDAIRFNPQYLAFAAHYRFEPRPVAVARGNEKGRVERSIRYIRDNFFAARTFVDVDDLNSQARTWTAGAASDRPWPEGSQMTVGAAFDHERPRLMSMPPNPYPLEERVEVQSAKTPYVRFDLNDYSIPHTHVQRSLTVLASADRIRILDGTSVLAEHPRSFDKAAQIEKPEHLEALKLHKSRARHHSHVDRLSQSVPAMAEFLSRAALAGHHLASITRTLNEFLDHYGAPALQAAVLEALRRDVAHPNAVRHALEHARELAHAIPLVVPQLSEKARALDVHVPTRGLDAYDALQTTAITTATTTTTTPTSADTKKSTTTKDDPS